VSSVHGHGFRVRFPIRWGDADSARIIFYVNYFKLFEAAEDEFFRAHGRPLHELQSEFAVWNPRVETHATFLYPARVGDLVEVEVRISKIGKSSARYEYEITRADPQPAILLARGYTVTVCVSQETFRAVPIPPPMREILQSQLLKMQP